LANDRRLSRVALLSLGAVCVALAAGPAHAAESVVDQPVQDVVLAAHGRAVAYSAFDATTGLFRLRIKVGSSAPRDVPVPPRSVPFDASVARAYVPGKGHADVLVYSRCRREPDTAGGIAPERDWTTSRGCTLRMTPFDGPEQLITGAGAGVLPSVAGTTLAYARFSAQRAPQVIVRRLNRTAAPLRTFGGPSLAGHAQGPAAIAVFANHVAVTWRYDHGNEGQNSRLLVVDVKTGRRMTVRAVNGGGLTAHAIVGASWLGDQSLQWGEICAGDPGGCPGRSRYGRWAPGHKYRLAAAPTDMRAYATTATATWTLRGCASPPAFSPNEPGARCDLVEQSPAPLVPVGT
jgi:hypothetical protein